MIGRSRDYDLLYFRTERSLTPPDRGADRRHGGGRLRHRCLRQGAGWRAAWLRGLNMPVEARCPTCAVQSAFTFEGNAGRASAAGR
ncbi:MAG: hypothetical protein WDM81_08655 [Rhizomicrobium sp.]